MSAPLAQVGKQLSWALLVRGVIAILFGITALAWPGITVLALIFLFAAYAFVDGAIALARAWQVRGSGTEWLWWAAVGVVSIGAGIVAIAWPGITAVALLYLLAFYSILFGVMGVLTAIGLRELPGSGWVFDLVAASLSILFGIVLLASSPAAGIIAIVWVLAWYAIIFGAMMVGSAIQFLRMNR